MRKVALVLVWIVVAAGAAQAVNPTLSAGGGGMNVLQTRPDVIWSEPPNLDGLIATSEIIGQYGVVSETVNDFVPGHGGYIYLARWWGGYFGNYGCSDAWSAPYWNLRYYEDGGCVPSALVMDRIGVFGNETFVYCQGGSFPIFAYQAFTDLGYVEGNTRLWFSAQAADHAYPPQCGRLASASVVGCESLFRSSYFGYPDWTSTRDVFGEAFDVSQEFEAAGIGEHIDRYGACCFGDQGECRVIETQGECDYLGGEWQGYGSRCDPNPCAGSPVQAASWGQIKNLFR